MKLCLEFKDIENNILDDEFRMKVAGEMNIILNRLENFS